jgi:OPA family glycerol-3-phosphate transporter-like MFS transporter
MKLSYARELNEYPTGLRRIWILTMVVLAILIGSYEAEISPVVPLLLKDLHMTLTTYGSLSALAVVAGAIASGIGGRLTDHYGRVKLLIPLMLVTGLLCFVMVLVHSPTQLLLARILLAVVDGMALAGTAPLVRDFTPRMGRAQGFGFWTWGPVGANFLVAAIAGITLPIFHDSWRSQFVIMGIISLAVSILIVFNIRDLSPELRERIRQTEHREVTTADTTRPARIGTLLARPNLWAHVIGISFWLVLYLTLLLYGPTMLGASFHVNAATASSIMAGFWVLNLATLIIIGRISDRLQLRKPISVLGTAAAAAVGFYLVHLVHSTNVAHSTIAITGALLGGFLGIAYGPWMANYSEDAEDIDPRLQGTAWGIYGFASKAMAVVVLLVLPLVVAAGGWGTWLIVANVCLIAFIPATVLFHGPWRRGRAAGADAVPAERPATPVS